ncbi:hypothetical protein PXNS11_210120 [Stutzerimonas xanthomarina]|nr:hypothetical protein PXNS11_210120 [Stutzerimonas xanthomarina]
MALPRQRASKVLFLFMDALFECESGCGQSIAVHRAWRVLRAEERSIRAISAERGASALVGQLRREVILL